VENIVPEVLGKLLNEYTGGMTEIVFSHEGTVGKINRRRNPYSVQRSGDQPDYATRAVACAHELDAWAEAFKQRWRAAGVNFGATRIGVHAGPALSAISAEASSSTTRLTATPSTPRHGFRRPTSSWARESASASRSQGRGEFQGRPVGDIVLRGRSEPLRAYEPLREDAFSSPATAQYSAALPSSRPAMRTPCRPLPALVGSHADDALAGFHLKRLLNGAKGVRMQLE